MALTETGNPLLEARARSAIRSSCCSKLPRELQGICLRPSGKETVLSIYKRGGVYWFEFRFQGRRYRDTTGLTNKTAATSAEAIRRAELAEGRAGIRRAELAEGRAVIVKRVPCPAFED